MNIEFDDRAVRAALLQLLNRAGNLRPALAEAGEDLKESTHKRFESSTSPTGKRWLLNTPATLAHKEGDKPLVDHHALNRFIHAQLPGQNTLEIGSTMEYAAMMQFGGTKAEFPWLWGDIPARPFLGLSSEDESGILAIFARHLDIT